MEVNVRRSKVYTDAYLEYISKSDSINALEMANKCMEELPNDAISYLLLANYYLNTCKNILNSEDENKNEKLKLILDMVDYNMAKVDSLKDSDTILEPIYIDTVGLYKSIKDEELKIKSSENEQKDKELLKKELPSRIIFAILPIITIIFTFAFYIITFANHASTLETFGYWITSMVLINIIFIGLAVLSVVGIKYRTDLNRTNLYLTLVMVVNLVEIVLYKSSYLSGIFAKLPSSVDTSLNVTMIITFISSVGYILYALVLRFIRIFRREK